VKPISREQRRARLGHRHLLASRVGGAGEAVTALIAVHSSDPVTVFLSMWARVTGFEVGDLERLLYEERSLVRHWAMRRTLWVVDRETIPLLISSSTRPLGERERPRTARMIEEGRVAPDGEAWLNAALPRILEAISERGEVLTRRITQEIPGLGDKIVITNRSGKVVGTTGAASRALVQLGLESRVVRARPAGTWVSGQYRWAVMEDWLGGPIADIPQREASARLVDRWLAVYGPATATDVRWWTGWPVRRVRQALEDVGVVEVDLAEEGSGFVVADDIEDLPEPEDWVALLPSLDTTAMGWKEREWYLGDHFGRLFDRNGNAGPTVWVNGRIVGGWAQRPDGRVVHELFEDVGTEMESVVETRRNELQEWLGDVTITPRFRSPHDKELSS